MQSDIARQTLWLRSIVSSSLLVLTSLSFSSVAFSTAFAAEKAPCIVCTARGEGGHPETVVATTDYEGKTYSFCSIPCQEQFVANPLAYLPKTLPRPAPAFTLNDLRGAPHALEGMRGKPVLLDFWATWCRPCIKFFPELRRIQEEYGPRGLLVLGVAIDEDPKKVPSMAEKQKLAYPTLLDDAKDPLWRRYGVMGIPATFLIDAQGQIVREWKGEVKREELEAAIEALLPPRTE